MFETPSKILTSVILGLGRPESELLQEAEAMNLVFRKLALYYEGIRQSDQNLMAEVTSEFTLTTGQNSKDLTSLTSSDSIFPLWCERKIYDATNDRWEFVPTVNANIIPERQERNECAVAFYGDTANQVTALFSIYGDEESAPYNTFRVWYAPSNTFTNNKDATVAIPDTLTSLVVVDVQLNLIPLLVVNASKYLAKRPELAARIAAWEAMKEPLANEKIEWLRMWENWRKRSRGFHRATNHSDVLNIH